MLSFENMPLFRVGLSYPPIYHAKRVQRYRENKKLFLGDHQYVFDSADERLTANQQQTIFIAANLPGVIAKKSADFLLGETPIITAGAENSAEQTAIDRLIEENDFAITNYESALGNAYRGDSFYKIRWSQNWQGLLPPEQDPFRLTLESQNAEYVFPETLPDNAKTIFAYHIAIPIGEVTMYGVVNWSLNVESHYPGLIKYSTYKLEESRVDAENNVIEWLITAELTNDRADVETGVPYPLVVHVPNYALDDTWEGIDDLSEHKSLFDEIDCRLSQIATILDKHTDPALAVPSGTLQPGEDGIPVFRVTQNKVFEIDGKDDFVPMYITWNGQLEAAFKELEHLIDLLLMTAELPAVALGKDNSGTSGASGLSIKWRMGSLLAKINRKRQYYDKGLRNVLYIAQLLEHAQSDQRLDYKPTWPKINFKDGLPDDELEMANIYAIRTGSKPTVSQRTAIKTLDGLTDEQVDAEMKRIADEENAAGFVSSSVFNGGGGGGA